MILLIAKLGLGYGVIVVIIILLIIGLARKSKDVSYNQPKSNQKAYSSAQTSASINKTPSTSEEDSISDFTALDDIIAQNKSQESVINDIPKEKLAYIPKNDKRLIVAKAIKTDAALEFYYSNYNGEASKRTVSNLDYSEEFGTEYISGFCHLREEDRTFKIERISRLKVVS